MRFEPLAPGLLALLGLVACDGAPPPVPCDPADRGTVSYALEDMLCVQLEMDEADFVALGEQFRFEGDGDDQLEGIIGHVLDSCTEPFPDPYTYFPADLTVDGLQADGVGVRKKGFVGSVLSGSAERPSLKIKTDAFVDDQLLPDDTERVTLNNNLTDATRMRTCLAYSVFDDAGYPAPRCNLASVTVNGEPLGAYTHVEPIKKRFLERAFGDDEGSLYELTLTDFTEEYLADGLGRWEAKTDDTDPTTALLLDVADALTAPDDELEQALEQVLDLELFFRFWALETLINHRDGYNSNSNNSFVYFDPGDDDRAVFIPWGPDDAMKAEELVEEGSEAAAFASSEIARRLSRHPELSQRYPEALRAALDAWDEDALLERVEMLDAQIASSEPPGDSRAETVATLETWISGRRAEVEEMIELGALGAAEPTSCGAAVEFMVFADLGEVVGTMSHSCASRPGAPGGLWPAGLLAVALLGRRRYPSATSSLCPANISPNATLGTARK